MTKVASLLASIAFLFGTMGAPVIAQVPNDGTVQTQQRLEDDSPNLWWALPLLAIPVIWYMLKRTDDVDRDKRRTDNRTGRTRFEGEL